VRKFSNDIEKERNDNRKERHNVQKELQNVTKELNNVQKELQNVPKYFVFGWFWRIDGKFGFQSSGRSEILIVKLPDVLMKPG
jgi:hypothetical protein